MYSKITCSPLSHLLLLFLLFAYIFFKFSFILLLRFFLLYYSKLDLFLRLRGFNIFLSSVNFFLILYPYPFFILFTKLPLQTNSINQIIYAHHQPLAQENPKTYPPLNNSLLFVRILAALQSSPPFQPVFTLLFLQLSGNCNGSPLHLLHSSPSSRVR
jgi:hypothetical protein